MTNTTIRTRIIGWIGSIDELKYKQANLTSEKNSSGSKENPHIHEPEGVRRIYELLSLNLHSITGILIEKLYNSEISISFFSNNELILPIGLQTSNEKVKNNKFESDIIKNMTELNNGFLSVQLMASHFPSNFIDKTSTWVPGTNFYIKIEQIKEADKISSQEVLDVIQALTNIINTNTNSSQNSTKSHTEGNNALRTIFGADTHSTSTSKSHGGSYNYENGNLNQLKNLLTNHFLELSSKSNTNIFITVYISTGLNNHPLFELQKLCDPNISCGIEYEFEDNLIKFKKSIEDSLYTVDDTIKNLKATKLQSQAEVIDDSKKIIHTFLDNLDLFRNYTNLNILSWLLNLPPKSIHGLKYDLFPNLEINPPNFANVNDLMNIGDVYNINTSTGKLKLPLSILSEHIAILGKTGSGKTNTSKVIAQCIATQNIPVVIIEGAKDEYVELEKCDFNHFAIGKSSFKIPIFWVNSIETKREINGFKVFKAPSLNTHISFLWDAFSSAFPIEGPMIPLLKRGIEDSYKKFGWNLNLDEPEIIGNPIFPSIDDLISEIKAESNRLGYLGEAKNISIALENRLTDFKYGSKFRIFNTEKIDYINLLFTGKNILSLDCLESEEDKSFFTSILFGRIRQIIKEIQWGNSHNKLNMLIIVEEAHRIAPNVNSEDKASPTIGKQKEMAVSTFNNAIAEFRAYGIGIAVIDQSPSKISIDVLRNIGTKFIHTIQERDDKKIVASILGLPEEYEQSLGNLPDRGFALFQTREKSGSKARLVKIQEFKAITLTEGHKQNKSITQEDYNYRIKETTHNQNISIANLYISILEGKNSLIKINPTNRNSIWRLYSTSYGINESDNFESWIENISPNADMRFSESHGCLNCKAPCSVPILITLINSDKNSFYKGNITQQKIIDFFFNIVSNFPGQSVSSDKAIIDSFFEHEIKYGNSLIKQINKISPSTIEKSKLIFHNCMNVHRNASFKLNSQVSDKIYIEHSNNTPNENEIKLKLKIKDLENQILDQKKVISIANINKTNNQTLKKSLKYLFFLFSIVAIILFINNIF